MQTTSSGKAKSLTLDDCNQMMNLIANPLKIFPPEFSASREASPEYVLGLRGRASICLNVRPGPEKPETDYSKNCASIALVNFITWKFEGRASE